MIKQAFHFPLLIILLACTGLFAQSDSLRNNDSINAVILENYNDKLLEIEKQRLKDSTQRIALLSALDSLKADNDLKKEELKKQLQIIDKKDQSLLEEKKVESTLYVKMPNPTL